MSGITSVAADNVHNLSPKHSKMPIADMANAGMFVSALLASGIAVFDMAIMNYPTYGFPAHCTFYGMYLYLYKDTAVTFVQRK